MVITAKELVKHVDRLAPPGMAEDWDNCGWQVGDPAAPVERVLVALDVTPEVVLEAEAIGAQLIVSHHPMFLKGLKSLRRDTPVGDMVFRLIRAGIGVYAAHTNLDSAQGGVNDVLARELGLQEIEPLRPVTGPRMFKLVVFVPLDHAAAVREALGKAGAGWIGNYSHCTFNVTGTGTFLPGDGSKPYIGAAGKLEQVEEVRIETIVKQGDSGRVIQAMLDAHPYEEVAYDLYPLEQNEPAGGIGRVGLLPAAVSLAEFVRRVRDGLKTDNVRYGGRGDQLLRRIAVCGGSGGDLWPMARQKGADVLVTGDVRYHAARDMLQAGICFIDAGHYATERVVLPELRDKLSAVLGENGSGLDRKVEIFVATSEEDVWHQA